MQNRFRFVDKHLGRILVEKGVINEGALNMALAYQKKSQEHAFLGQLLIDLELVQEEDVLGAVNVQYRFPYIPVARYAVNAEAMRCIPAQIAHQHNLIPLDKFGEVLLVAMANPLSPHAWEALRSCWDKRVEVCISTSAEISSAIHASYHDLAAQEDTCAA